MSRPGLTEHGSNAAPNHVRDVGSRILTAIAEKDRYIDGMNLAISLGTNIAFETDQSAAVQRLVDAACELVSCEDMCLFTLTSEGDFCRACIDGLASGGRKPRSPSAVRAVRASGEALCVADAVKCPEHFGTVDGDAGRTYSALYVPLKDSSGATIAVLEAVNRIQGEEGMVSCFNACDEHLLQTLLRIAAPRLCADFDLENSEHYLMPSRSQLPVLEAIASTTELREGSAAMAAAIRMTLRCTHVLLFALDKEYMVCFAGTYAEAGLVGLKLTTQSGGAGDSAACGFLDRAVASGNAELLSASEEAHREELLAFGKILKRPAGVGGDISSALCAPMRGDGEVAASGLILAIDKIDLPEDSEHAFSSERLPSSCTKKTSFQVSDLEAISGLITLASQFVDTCSPYAIQRRLACTLDSVLMLLSDSQSEVGSHTLAYFVCSRAVHMLACDRCTLFTVDYFNSEFIGYYSTGQSSSELLELRVPISGIAGAVYSTGEVLNVQDAWAHKKFDNATDLRTGYRTRTLLCAPLASSTGKVLGVIECVNKKGGVFSKSDERLLLALSKFFAGELQRVVHDDTYDAFVKRNDAVNAEVKAMLSQYHGKSLSTAYVVIDDDAKLSDAAPQVQASSDDDAMLSRSSSDQWRPLRCWRVDPALARIAGTGATGGHVDPFGCFHDLNLLSSVGISALTLHSCMAELRAGYLRPNPYHNWGHAYLTMHIVYRLLDSLAFYGSFSPLDMFALLISALGHDIEHPGVTNNYIINTWGKLALIYNDLAVLENHHAATLFSVIRKPSVELLAGMDLTAQRRFRTMAISTILATDMAQHKNSIKWLESSGIDMLALQAAGEKLEPGPAASFGEAILHSSDLAHPTMPWVDHRRFSALLGQEFYNQHQEEERLGLPTLPFMGKDPEDLSLLGPIQVGFLQFVAQPLWSAMNFVAGDNRLVALVQNVESNREVWQKISDGEAVSDEQPWMEPPNAIRKPECT